MSPERVYEEGSPADYAHRGFQRIKELATSDKTVEKLEGFNILLFVLVGAVIASQWIFQGESLFSLQFGMVFGISTIFAAIAGYLYSFLTDALTSFSEKATDGLRLAIVIEFIALSAAWTGLLFNILLAVKIAAVLLLLQAAVILFGQFISITEFELGADQKWGGFWTGMGRMSSLITVLTFLYNVAIVLIRFAS